MIGTAQRSPSSLPAISISSCQDWSVIAPIWLSLAEASDASFFLSSSWVETWIEIFASELRPEFLLFSDPMGAPVGVCILVHKTVWRKFIPMRTVFLNCAGEGGATHSTWIEFNQLLCLAEQEQAVANALTHHLRGIGFDELALQGVTAEFVQLGVAAQLGNAEVVTQPSYYVDLDDLRASGKSYDQAISSSEKKQIRRGRELYEEHFGKLQFSEAKSIEEALGYLQELTLLHQSAWTKRGKPGAFSSAAICRFHEALVRRALPQGQIQLLKLTAGTEIVGVLYNFVYKGKVYFYQSGFLYSNDNRFRPGFVMIHQAVHHCLAKTALSEYHFLAGDSHYKRSLSTAYRDLSWLIVRRKTLRTWIFLQMRDLWRRHGKSSS